MDIRKISLHLSGKISPYLKYSRLEFFEHLEDIFGYSIEKQKFYWEQSKEFEEEFYYLVLEKLYSKWQKNEWEKEKLEKLLKEMNLPEDIYQTFEWFDYKWLKEEFDWMITKKTKKETWDSQIKWKQLEVFLENLFNSIEWLEVTEINQAEDEEIDLVIKNNINKAFWLNLNSPVIIWEAKNWTKNTPVKEIAILSDKMSDHNNFTRIWFFIAMNWFTKVTEKKLERKWATDKIIVKIEWDDIKELLEKKLNSIEWLEWLVMKSFV